MAFIPRDARWYIADVILEHTIQDDPRNVVHTNTLLVEADSPEEAHRKALDLGKAAELEYENTDGKLVRTVFRGLRELKVIHDELVHGAELFYSEDVGVPEEKIQQWITPKEELGAFAPRRAKTDGPNYLPDDIMKQLKAAGFSQADIEGDQP